MSVDNRTIINDCEATTNWTGDDGMSTDTAAGAFYEGATALTWQAGSASEQMSTTEDSVATGTFSLDWSDSTLYMLTKDNLAESFANGGIQVVIGDGTRIIGYNVGGNDAAGLSLPVFFSCYKLDVSVVVITPGGFTAHAGVETSMAHSACTVIGVGVDHQVNAMGPSDNTTQDCLRYIANDSYALTVNGGTVATPETMTDLVADDVTNGWGMVSNPLGSQFLFFAPTEWGNASTIAEHAFEATSEQWYWIGDNAGGHAVGDGHFIFRVVANATDAGTYLMTSVVVVSTGTPATLDHSDTDIDTLEIDLCSFTGLASYAAPSSGGTSRFCTNTTFAACGTVTHNGASMNGCSVLESTVDPDTGAMVYNEATDPDGETDNMTFSIGGNAHHALEFGTSAPLTMTLTGWTVTGFHVDDAENSSTFLFPDTGSDVTWTLNLVDFTGNDSFKQVRVGDTVIVQQSVALELNGVTEGTRCSMIGDGGAEDGVELLAGYADSTGKLTGSFGGTTPQNVKPYARNGGIINAAILDDAGVFTDYTDDARDSTGTDDINLLPTPVAVADRFYFGGINKFAEVLLNVTTAGTTYDLKWEYHNGSIWTALTVVDNTNSFQTAGWNTITFTKPSDWTAQTVDSKGPFFYIRAEVDTTGGGTQPQAENITTNQTTKYLPFNADGSVIATIAAGTGLTATATWVVDPNNP